MQTRRFGATGIGFGGWTIAGPGWSSRVGEPVGAAKRAVEPGMNRIDTAAVIFDAEIEASLGQGS